MGLNTEFDTLEQEFLKLIEELQRVTSSESSLRKAVLAESTFTEAANAAIAVKAEAEARSADAAANSAANHTSATLAKLQDELSAYKMQFELAERHRTVLDKKCSQLTSELETLKQELDKLRSLKANQVCVRIPYGELQERVQSACNEARRESTRLDNEIRRVAICASGGVEMRDRARLAAAAHMRERRLTAAEMHHNVRELLTAKGEIIKLGVLLNELQFRVNKDRSDTKNTDNPTVAALAETRAALQVEKAGSERLEKALAAALADNAALTAKLNAVDNPICTHQQNPEQSSISNNTSISPINSFLDM